MVTVSGDATLVILVHEHSSGPVERGTSVNQTRDTKTYIKHSETAFITLKYDDLFPSYHTSRFPRYKKGESELIEFE